MRDFENERVVLNRACDHARAKVAAIERLVASLKPGHPNRIAAERLLQQMRQNASDAELNRTLLRAAENKLGLPNGLLP